jgi:hypothetical protein
MPFLCKDVCNTHIGRSYYSTIFGKSHRYYKIGTKYCSICTKKVDTLRLRCICCGSMLRITNRQKVKA